MYKKLIAATLTLLLSPALAEQWDFATGYQDNSHHTKLARMFALEVAEATQGKYKIRVHSNGSLVAAKDIKQATATGTVVLGERLLSSHQNDNILYGFDAIPFLATSPAEVDQLWQAAKEVIRAELAKENLVLLYSIPFPPQGMYFNQAINAERDLNGLNIRVYNPTGSSIAKALGMIPHNIESAELRAELAKGYLQAVLTSTLSGTVLSLWDYMDYYYTVQAWSPRNYVFINKDIWDYLDREDQEIILSIARLIEEVGRVTTHYTDRLNLATLASHAVKIETPTALARSLDEIGAKMQRDWQANAGPAGAKILRNYQTAIER